MESIYELWGKRNPEWEKRYQDSIINVFTDYSKGVNQYQEVRGKIFGAGYEIFIIAFFIGLYYNQTKPLVEDKEKRKVFGLAIMYWGNIESRLNRKQYPKIRDYMFAALVARTDIDWIALDKGEITSRSVVDKLIDKMEQYANFGFDYMQEKLEENPNHFFKETSFLRIFTSFLSKSEDEVSDEPEPLDDDPIETAVNQSIESVFQPPVTSQDVEELKTRKKEHWYSKFDDFEITAYRKGPEFWENAAEELSAQNIISHDDVDFLKNMARLMNYDKLLSDKQLRKLYMVVKSSVKAGYDFD